MRENHGAGYSMQGSLVVWTNVRIDKLDSRADRLLDVKHPVTPFARHIPVAAARTERRLGEFQTFQAPLSTR